MGWCVWVLVRCGLQYDTAWDYVRTEKVGGGCPEGEGGVQDRAGRAVGSKVRGPLLLKKKNRKTTCNDDWNDTGAFLYEVSMQGTYTQKN